MPITRTDLTPHPAWLFSKNPAAIEQQEAEGQRELINDSTRVPADIWGRTDLEQRGCTFSAPLADDSLFCQATFPEGWHLVATDHAMWTELRDADGTLMASIFYKAAFYDRQAHMTAIPLAPNKETP